MRVIKSRRPTAIKGTMNTQKHRSAKRYELVQKLARFIIERRYGKWSNRSSTKQILTRGGPTDLLK
jgi:DNA replication initiation complex subunit (GINS family)